MTTLFLSNLRSKHSTACVLFGWFMLFSLVLQTTAFSPLIASADVVANVSHTDGTVSHYELASSTDDVVVSYTMGATSASGTPTLAALSGILASLNTALVSAKADASANCSGTASSSASASASGEVTIDGVTTIASATANSSANCTGNGTGGSYASSSSSSTVIITTGGTPQTTNTKPVITVLGTNPATVIQGTVYTDLGATVLDHEDGDITSKLVTTGIVNTALVGSYTISYNATDTKNLAADTKTRTVNVISGTSCSLDVYSDTSDHVSGGVNAVATYSGNPRWTTEIPGATWIWNSYLVANPTTDEVTFFSKDISVTRPVASAVMTLAADNSYKFSLNGAIVGVDNTEYNYQEEHKHVYDVASNLHLGVNTIAFEVKNWALQGSTAYTNPAGVLYHLHITYGGEGCTTPTPINQKPVITVNGANPASVTQGAHYTDLGATVLDPEDGDITLTKLVTTGTVNTAVIGSYTISYNATDTKNLAADTKTRTVNVVARAACTLPTDTILIIDRSGSMDDDGTNPPQPLTKAKDAANGYIDTLSASADHVGVVSFSDTPTLNMSLTSNFAAAKNSILALTAYGNTNIATALTMGTAELDTNGRANTKHVIILLSDGKPEPDTTAGSIAAVTAAGVAKSKGYTIYTIGLGTGVVPSLMTAIASVPANYYFAPTALDLAAIYQTISATECQRVPATIAGHKYNDLNGDGSLSQGETGLSGWTITLASTNPAIMFATRMVTTNAAGEYLFNDVPAGSYRLCEENQTGWNMISPVDGCKNIDVVDGINYTSKDFFNTRIPVIPPTSCTLDVVSDSTTLVDGGANAVVTYAANPAWTASVPGATWIWKSFNVANPAINDTTNFSKNFTITDPIASAVVTLAADNNFSFGVNGTVVGSDNSGINFATAKTFDVASKLHTGVNAATFSVTNIGLVGSTPTSNPAGLLYKLHVVYNKTGCDTPPPANQIPVITLIGANPLVVHINTVFS